MNVEIMQENKEETSEGIIVESELEEDLQNNETERQIIFEQIEGDISNKEQLRIMSQQMEDTKKSIQT